MTLEDRRNMVRSVLRWYRKNGRDLPWRRTRDPYKILVSEIMLQQTQVHRVMQKYTEFLKAFPTVEKLAAAKPADVIRIWKGLGYNRRALYLQSAAQMVVDRHAGTFPSELQTLKQLPGVGEYTARALLSFAFGESVVMMDTNHRRFYQRVLFGRTPRSDEKLLRMAEQTFPKRSAYHWNQALMDLGQFVCTERSPVCKLPFLEKYCRACAGVGRPPKKIPRKNTVRFRDSDRYYRGRIVDALREEGKIIDSTLERLCGDISVVRKEKIIDKLEKDGLIKRLKASIVLP